MSKYNRAITYQVYAKTFTELDEKLEKQVGRKVTTNDMLGGTITAHSEGKMSCTITLWNSVTTMNQENAL